MRAVEITNWRMVRVVCLSVALERGRHRLIRVHDRRVELLKAWAVTYAR